MSVFERNETWWMEEWDWIEKWTIKKTRWNRMFTSHCSPWSWRAVHVGVALFGSANGDSNAAPIPGPSRHFLLVHFYHQASKWRRIDILVRKPLRPAIVRVNSRRPPFVESVFIFKGNISFFFSETPSWRCHLYEWDIGGTLVLPSWV